MSAVKSRVARWSPRLSRGRSARHWMLLVPSLVLFLLLSTVSLEKPGLHYDEALEAGLPAVQLLRGQPLTVPNGAALRLSHWQLPLMVQNHIGAAQVYAALPFVLVGGTDVISLRAMTVVVGLLTIVAVYLFLLQLYGPVAALYGSLWLSTFASFIFWFRQGVFVTSLAACFAAWALACGAYWWRTGRLSAMALAGLCFGLAIYSKLSALWLLNGVVGWWLIGLLAAHLRGNSGRRDPRVISSVRPRAAIYAALGLLAGAWPVLLYNVLSDAATLSVIERSTARTYLGTSNTDLLGNLLVRLRQAADVVVSGDHLWYLGGSFPNSLALLSVLAALVYLVGGSLREDPASRQRVLLVPFLGLAVLVQSCYTISALWHTHFAVAAPLPAMIFGVAVARVLERPVPGRPARAARWGVLVLAAVLLVSQAVTSLRYVRAVVSTGGLSFHSSAIYQLVHYLEQRQRRVVALDWGLAAQVRYLSGGRVQVEEFFEYEQEQDAPDPALMRRLDPDMLYITHAPAQEAFPARAAFRRAAAAVGVRPEPVKVLSGAEGPLIEVWRLRELP